MTKAIAYFIQCHESADRLKLLFRSIYRPEAIIFIHCDKKSPAIVHETATRIASKFENVSILDSQWVSWGGFSQVQILVEGLRAALKSRVEWDHFILLSEHHVAVRDPNTFADFLKPGVSYFSSKSYHQMGDGIPEINYRFSSDFREVRAWGMFPTTALSRREWVSQNVHHGSNWVVLSRRHCALVLQAVDGDTLTVQHMRNAVQPDEMFVQTILASAVVTGQDYQNSDLTYVAWPHLSGTNNLTFIESNYFDARDQGFLFIRKAPKIIPPLVLREIDTFSAFTPDELTRVIDADHRTQERILTEEVQKECKKLGFTGIDVAKNAPHFCPKFYIKFTRADFPSDIFVGLLSQDLEAFKLLICWRHRGDEPLGFYEVGGFKTHDMKVRVADLMMNREVIVPTDRRNGFFKKTEFRTAKEMAEYAKTYLDYAKKFSERM